LFEKRTNVTTAIAARKVQLFGEAMSGVPPWLVLDSDEAVGELLVVARLAYYGRRLRM